MDRGLVIILPGIEGPSMWNANIARGLNEGGVRCGIEVYDWGTNVPGGMLINLADIERNRAAARGLSEHIRIYQAAHPGKPVHVIGHSGGGGIAVLAAELLSRDRPLTTAILLAPALSPDYDLTEALARTRYGIFCYYSPYDAALLRVGTSMAGTIDRRFGQAAGAVGFTRPGKANSEDASPYTRLHQVCWTPAMRRSGHLGGHMGWTERRFVREYLAPLIADFNRGGVDPGW
jgi:pimeloyl-ACP methyl ester carboxylesterase